MQKQQRYHRFQELQKTENALIFDNFENVFKSVDIIMIKWHILIVTVQSGAHFVIDTTNDLPEVIAEINKRMAMGLRPWTHLTLGYHLEYI